MYKQMSMFTIFITLRDKKLYINADNRINSQIPFEHIV